MTATEEDFRAKAEEELQKIRQYCTERSVVQEIQALGHYCHKADISLADIGTSGEEIELCLKAGEISATEAAGEVEMLKKIIQKRNPLLIGLLSVVTLGIYEHKWLNWTVGEMNPVLFRKGAALLTPPPRRFVGRHVGHFWVIAWLHWLWSFGKAVAVVTDRRLSAKKAFVLTLLPWLSPAGPVLIQSSLNDAIDRGFGKE